MEFVGDGILLNNVNELQTLINKDSYNNETIEDFRKDFPHEVENLEEI